MKIRLELRDVMKNSVFPFSGSMKLPNIDKKILNGYALARCSTRFLNSKSVLV